MLFSINCVEKISTSEIPDGEKQKVGECDGKLYKGLKSKRYFFNDFYKHNQDGELQKTTSRAVDKCFFGPHINVQAVVGENGSGKSSLMELIYIAINNFSYMFERGHDDERPGAERLCYVPGLFVKIHFSFGKRIYRLESKGLVIDLFCDETNKGHFEIGDGKKQTDKEIADLIDDFFYTIVTNYSLQSFIPTNYIHEVYVFESGQDKKIDKENAGDCIWINNIFHKNDGYIRSIVLNPYRNNGNVDITNELNLSKDRTCALFLWAMQNKKEYFAPYEYFDLKLSLNKNFLKNKIKRFWRLTKDESDQFDASFSTDEDCLKIINWDIAQILVEKFQLSEEIKETSTDVYKKRAMLYLQLKILSIINKYDSFLGYKNTIIFEKDFSNPQIELKDEMDSLINALDNRESHITKKVMRAIWFLKLSANAINKVFNSETPYNGEIYFDELSNEYMDEFYEKLHRGQVTSIDDMDGPFNGCRKDGNRSFTDPVWIDRVLPPSIFNYELLLRKETEVVSFADLSSGELQMLETLSVHSYHVENILSVKKKYIDKNGNEKYHPKYKCINLVFDEVEMCFHPDFQRQFVYRMLDLITSMKQNWAESGGCYLNIIILTHSPFILSDIPNTNILYLQNGEDVSDDINMITFASNINNMLYHSFFLGNEERGFVGEFAKRKIESLVKYFETGRSNVYPNNSGILEWTEEWANHFSENIIGDDMIKRILLKIKKVN